LRGPHERLDALSASETAEANAAPQRKPPRAGVQGLKAEPPIRLCDDELNGVLAAAKPIAFDRRDAILGHEVAPGVCFFDPAGSEEVVAHREFNLNLRS